MNESTMEGPIPEVWELVAEGEKRYIACGPRDVLIIKSNESLISPNIEPRKKGILTEEDKEKLKREDIPRECWDNDAKLMVAKLSKDNAKDVLPIEDNPDMTTKSVLDKIKSLLETTRKPGVNIIYFGSGRKKTGDWCFKDGYVTFDDIMQLYNKYFMGKCLGIVSDCSYSGNWVQLGMDYLDKCKVTPCLHSARASGKIMAIVASCQSYEIPSSLLFVARGYYNDKNTGKLFVRVPYHVAANQNIRYCNNFTMICTAANLDSECLLPLDYNWQKKRIAERLILQYNLSEWQFFLMVDDDEIHHQIRVEKANLAEFGEIVKSGEGEIPEDVKKWIDNMYPGNLFNWKLTLK